MGNSGVWAVCFVVVVSIPFSESAMVFIREPDNPTHVPVGHNASLEWDYSIDDRKTELGSIIWSIFDTVQNREYPIIAEGPDGKRQFGTSFPQALRGRVNIKGRATLIISNVTVNDAAPFQCALRPKSGLDQKSLVRLVVTVPPKATIVKPRVKYGNVGDPITFTCNTSGFPTPNITWYRGNKIITGSSYSTNSVTPESSQLTIKWVSHDAQDYYNCQASSNGMEPANAKCFLGVIEGLKEDNKSCTKRMYEVQKGENVNLCCPVTAQPSPEVEWTFKGVKLGRFLSTVLDLSNISDADYGSYECTASDLSGTRKTFLITLNETTSTKIEDATQKKVIKRGEKFKWKSSLKPLHYLIQYSGKDILNDAVVGSSADQSLEIPFSTLKFKSEDRKPDPVEVTIVVWAIDMDGIIGQGGPFLKGLSNETSAATTSEAFTFTLIILIFGALNLQ
ncbi:neurotrimin-like isoform X2 [Stylophora pistillata]|uniref:neurotrimin-like isoform X2 n=1 Tax=Stylophora pistillata TaxID=50429 RepID=UPI000C043C10|nr:neurotrimin-like isoform X2 [Stylophora pistillata]